MQQRPLGRTGLQVSEIGFGAWGIGGEMWVGAEESESVRALERAIELGVTFLDTARGYGESERIVGEVVRRSREQELYVATKVPPRNEQWPAPPGLDPAEAFPAQHVRDSVETSLRVSGLETIDVLQLHGGTTPGWGAGTGRRPSRRCARRARSASSACRSTTTSPRTPWPSCGAAWSTRCR